MYSVWQVAAVCVLLVVACDALTHAKMGESQHLGKAVPTKAVNNHFAFLAKAFRTQRHKAQRHNSVEKGPIDDGLDNIATGLTATVSGSEEGREATYLNDGEYGDESTWVPDDQPVLFAMYDFGKMLSIEGFALGRDDKAEEDDMLGDVTIQVTADEDPTLPDASWRSIGLVNTEIDRTTYRILPSAECTGIRLVLSSTDMAIDEFEVYGDPDREWNKIDVSIVPGDDEDGDGDGESESESESEYQGGEYQGGDDDTSLLQEKMEVFDSDEDVMNDLFWDDRPFEVEADDMAMSGGFDEL